MKNNTLKLFVLSVMLGGSISLTAQTPEQKSKMLEKINVSKLKELSLRHEAEYKKNREEIVRLAQQNNWPLEIRENGKVSKLVEISSEGTPLYYTTFNEGSAITSRANHLQPGGSLGLNLTGAGISVGVWDGDYPLGTHEDFIGRFFANDGAPVPHAAHPTHVLGTIIGAGVSDLTARGIAYQADGVVYDFNADLSEMTNQAFFAALLVSNHSYGFDSGDVPSNWRGGYINKSRDLDELLFNNPYYQPVIAAGNDGNGNYDHLTAMGTSKNGVVVASVNQVSNYTGPGSVSLAGSSSWGPTDDKRIKPDIASKGVNVYSATNTGNSAHTNMSGTSMASPGVSGVFVLLQQHYSILNDGDYMLSATLRGLMAHTADEAGAFDGPDPKFGWGLINARKAAEVLTNDNEFSIVEERTLLPQQTYTFEVEALGSEPLIATIAWTDPAGTAFQNTQTPGPVLVNDLDIRIEKNGETFYPWRLADTNAAPAFQDDNFVDNIEKIEVNEPSGFYTVTVSHKGNTLVNPSGSAKQDYSLIISGVSVTLGTNDLDSKSSLFTVWPNPANDRLTISLPDGAEQGTNAVIYDVQGRPVHRAELNTVENVLDISSLSGGVYMVTVSNGALTQTKKVIVK